MKNIIQNKQLIIQSARKLPFKQREIVDEQVEEWIEDDIVELYESECANPIVVTYKKMLHISDYVFNITEIHKKYS